MILFQDDEVFTLNVNLIVMREGNEVRYALNKTCSPALPWAPREITCEANYMEVSLGLSCFKTTFSVQVTGNCGFSVGVREERCGLSDWNEEG